MPIDVEHVGGMLLRASADHEIWKRNAVAAATGKFTLRRLGRRNRRVVDPQVAVGTQVLLQCREVRRGPSAVQDLHSRDRAHAQLAVVDEAGAASHPGGLVEQDQRHAPSPTSSSTSTSCAAR